MNTVFRIAVTILLLVCPVDLMAGSPAAKNLEPLGFDELMRFRTIEDAVIAADGSWIAYTLKPDRGEYEVAAHAVDGPAEYRIEGGAQPVINKSADWLACSIPPSQKERDRAVNSDEKEDEKARPGMALLSLSGGALLRYEEVESFAFTEDGRWLVWKHHEAKDENSAEDKEESPSATPSNQAESEESVDEERPVGTTLRYRELATGVEYERAHVTAYAVDDDSRFLVHAVADPEGTANSLRVAKLNAPDDEELVLHQHTSGRYSNLAWAEDRGRLGFVAAVDDEDFEPGPAAVWYWEAGSGDPPRALATSADAPEGWRIPSANELEWSRDGERLFFGYQWIDPLREAKRLAEKEKKRKQREREAGSDGEEGAADDEDYDPFDRARLLDEAGLDVWHGDDPLIIPHQKKLWEKEKDRTYLAVIHLDSGTIVRLADLELPEAAPTDNPRAVLASSPLPYRKLQTWDGEYADLVHVDLNSGQRIPVAEKLRDPQARLSTGGRFVVYYRDRHWHLFDADSGTSRNLTADLAVGFSNEDDDYPAPDPGYAIAGWLADDAAVLIHDKYDLWRFPTGDELAAVNLTGGLGRRQARQFRVIDLDPEREELDAEAPLLLHSFDEKSKNHGFWQTASERAALSKLVESEHQYHFLAKAEEADIILYTRESYSEFPDLWTATSCLEGARKHSQANPQIEGFARGTAELVEWRSADGIPLEGVLIKPGNYEAGRRYPVLVYFYRFFSQRLHEFNEPVVNHRPNFAVYASHGYAVFLPDIRFEIGRPGLSAVKALVPGVQKLVDMGIADPDAIGLHGHSWSGYQTAQVITQTNIFKAAVAGAPVANMTSAYSGIRLGSGRARQFQYEMSQSRIGLSLDEGLPAYIENSPVFHARHVDTPLLIQFGDRDEAVPWQQGIELYLALRRLDKDVIFLQYRDEPHHLKKYPNKLDYSIKMKQFFDHHLKGEPAPKWMTDGVPYLGD